MLYNLLLRSGLLLLLEGSRSWPFLLLLHACFFGSISAFSEITDDFLLDTPESFDGSIFLSKAISDTGQLECLEVITPIIIPPETGPACYQTLMQHSFANSYGQPFIGEYIWWT
jgi:hypothetical protein